MPTKGLASRLLRSCLFWAGLLFVALSAFTILTSSPAHADGLSYLAMGGGFAGASELVMDAGQVKPWWLRLAVDSVAAQVPTIAFQEAQGRTWQQVGNRMAWAETGVLGVRIVKEW